MTDNLALWKRAFVTDPKAVKPITGKDYGGNSPKPYWIVERLTAEFGPCGIGWGYSIDSERFEKFSETDVLHVAKVTLWYDFETKRGTVTQMGQTKATYVTSGGKFKLDEDAPKKSVTDALVKCASYLGFAGDIFSGRWDDSKYVAEANKHWRDLDADAGGGAQNGTEANRQAMSAIQPEEQDHLRRSVPAIVAAAKDNPTQAKFLCEAAVEELSNDRNDPNILKMALWSLLDSKTRATIKAA